MGPNLPPIDLGAGRTAVRVVGGSGLHLCALLDNGSVKCWGYNTQGQLGLGDMVERGSMPNQMGDSLPAVALGSGRSAVNVAVGEAHACALLDDGQVKCWGRNESGELGTGQPLYRGDLPNTMGDALPVVDLGPGRTARSIATGRAFSCALLDNADIKCWGANNYGQLGLGDTKSRGRLAAELGSALPAVSFGAGKKAVQLSAGLEHACAVLDDGTASCWGWNAQGQLGLGIGVSLWGTSPEHLGANTRFVNGGTGRTFKRVVANSYSTCGFLDNNAVKCWGSNESFRLGNGDNVDRGKQPGQMGDNLPIVAPGGAGDELIGISIANGHGCGRLKSGLVKCWGALNQAGQLGLGDTAGRVQAGSTLPAVSL
jgi:E3 ubiquitin-protein ligase HERC3